MAEKLCVPAGLILQPTLHGFVTVRNRQVLFLDGHQVDVLGHFLRGATIDGAVSALSAKNGIASARLTSLIDDLVKYGLLEVGEDTRIGSPGVLTAHDLPESGPGETVTTETPLRISRSAVLVPSADGFVIEASIPFIATPEAIAHIPRFADGARPKAVLAGTPEDSREHTLRTIRQLHHAGVLVRSDAAPRPLGRAAPAAAPRSRRVGAAVGDGRIPVYPVLIDQPGNPPLALGLIIARAREYDGGRLNRRYRFLTEWYTSKPEVLDAVGRHGSGVILFSHYVWSEVSNLSLSAQLKRLYPDSLTVFGGPSAPKYEGACTKFMRQQPHVDVVVRGEGEITATELLDVLDWTPSRRANVGALATVRGLTYRAAAGADTCVRTADRERIADLAVLPSPYVTGVFDSMIGHISGITLETNRGCPYGCTFCDWGSATQQKIKCFPLERLRAEIEWVGRHRIEAIGCADANFGILQRDVEVARVIADVRRRYGYPRQWVVNYAKNATRRHAEILGIFRDAGIRAEAVLSIQSTEPQVLIDIRRTNIKTERYDELAHIFRAEGLDFSSDLMIGLPGQTVEGFMNDLQHFFDRSVFVQGYRTDMLPNSPMAEPAYVEKYRLKVRGRRVIASYSFSESQVETMQDLFGVFSFASNLSTLKYLLRYLQLDYGLRAVDVIRRIYDVLTSDGAAYPRLSWLLWRHLEALREMWITIAYRELDGPGSWDLLFAEVRALITNEYALEHASALDAILAAQAAVLPTERRAYPYRVALAHDVSAYMREQWHHGSEGAADAPAARPRRRLEEYAPAELVVADPYRLADGARDDIPDHSIRLELDSALWPVRDAAVERARDSGWYWLHRSQLMRKMRRVHPLVTIPLGAAAGGYEPGNARGADITTIPAPNAS